MADPDHKISLKEAQALVLHHQGLGARRFETPLDVLEGLGYVQIDTISVVERAHHHVFWTRLPSYRPEQLDQLISERLAFEYWSHAASYLPMRDYRFSLPRKLTYRKRGLDPELKTTMKNVLQRIKRDGPLRAKDFEGPRNKSNGWWDWKPAKRALERLFMEGKLEISSRCGFQKVYDLPENVIPSSVNTSVPTISEYARYLIIRTLISQAIATQNEIGYLMKGKIKQQIGKKLISMTSKGELETVSVEGAKGKHYTLPGALKSPSTPRTNTYILSPFDNLVIQRKRLVNLFDFEYQIECYVPASKRKFGYFSLPILKGTKFIGRLNCVANRSEKVLQVTEFYEKNCQKISNKTLSDFAKFNNCTAIELTLPE